MTSSPLVVVFDAETRPSPDWDIPEFVKARKAELTPPGNYKNPDTIEAWRDEQAAVLKARAALAPHTGVVRAIGACILGNADQTLESFAGPDEAEVLGWFLKYVARRRERFQPVILAGYNVREFDVPFLTGRMAAHRIRPNGWWPHRRDWNGIADAMEVFSRNNTGKLDDHLRAYGLPEKTGGGLESLDYDDERLAVYVADDARREEMLIDRLRHAFPQLRNRSHYTPDRGAVPFSRKELLAMPGIGEKTASSVEDLLTRYGLIFEADPQ